MSDAHEALRPASHFLLCPRFWRLPLLRLIGTLGPPLLYAPLILHLGLTRLRDDDRVYEFFAFLGLAEPLDWIYEPTGDLIRHLFDLF